MNVPLHAQVMREIAESCRIGREHVTVGAEFRAAHAAVGAGGRWFASPHAVAMWTQRYGRPGETYERALGALLAEADRAHFVKTLDTGPQLWRGPKPRKVRFIVSVCSEGSLPALVTVLPPFDGHTRRTS